MSKFICLACFSLVVLLSLPTAAKAQARFTVQLEATPELSVAQDKVKQYKGQGLDAYIVRTEVPGKGTFYRIRVGLFDTQADAKSYIGQLQKLGFGSDFYIASYERATEGLVPPLQKAVSVADNSPSGTLPLTKGVAKEQPPQSSKSSISSQGIVKGLASSTVASIVPSGAGSAPAPSSLSAVNFIKFQDPTIGFSFERPQYWEGGPLDPKDAQDQKVNAGALFKSYQDSAFINAIWNNLDKANSPDNDNDLIVELILRSMGSGDGTQMQELSRKVVSENGVIKTYLDLKAMFKAQGPQEGPLDFMGKAVIVRASKGILLVVAFYAKNGPSYVPSVAERIVASVRPPD
ncbi:MAG TPA: SPOR domain-containing protein [Blastocatellia bacterium]|nr:SPOR domain-containing protein [Blastocatellia bacterium]